jgi:dUTP pyrophosphatase
MQVKFKQLREGTVLPKYKTKGAAAFDFSAIVNDDNECFIDRPVWYSDPFAHLMLTENEEGERVLYVRPNQQCSIPTGWAVAIEEGWEMQIRPRSGLSLKHSITITNTPGTIDSDYRGEICVILRNEGIEPFIVRQGDRIAQGKVARAEQADLVLVTELDVTERGTGGFGSTG